MGNDRSVVPKITVDLDGNIGDASAAAYKVDETMKGSLELLETSMAISSEGKVCLPLR